MTFNTLRSLLFDIGWNVNVGLTDSDVLAVVNPGWGWNSRGVIPLGGLVRLLQTRPSLRKLALALDTRSYTEPPPSEVLASLELESTLPPKLSMDVLDSFIEADSVPVIADLFMHVAACSDLSFTSWNGWKMELPLNVEEYIERWDGIWTANHLYKVLQSCMR
ncbi:hypothetical protein EV363DRAFT_1325098 [Boletus edulis]|nr:hypothetical protein EV363DRAFT_1325098 [Boletus edulis]